jgi:hypothetical protein
MIIFKSLFPFSSHTLFFHVPFSPPPPSDQVQKDDLTRQVSAQVAKKVAAVSNERQLIVAYNKYTAMKDR